MPAATASARAVVTGTVTEVNDGGIEVRINDAEMTAFIRSADLSPRPQRPAPRAFRRGRQGRRPRHQYDRQGRRASQLSIKALEMAEEKEAVGRFGSSDSGASLGDILGAALKDREKN